MLPALTEDGKIKAQKRQALKNAKSKNWRDNAAREAAITAMVRNGWTDLLPKVLKREGDYQNYLFSDCLAALAGSRDLAMLETIIAHARVDDVELMRWAANEAWPEAADIAVDRVIGGYMSTATMAEFMSLADDRNFDRIYNDRKDRVHAPHLLRNLVTQGPAQLERFCRLIGFDGCKPNELSEAVIAYYEAGFKEVAPVMPLLAAGANANYRNGALMTAVLQAGDVDLAEKLIREYQFETGYFASHVYPALLEESASPLATNFAKRYAEKKAAPGAGRDFEMIDPVSVARSGALPNAGELTMVFNFGTQQQILIAKMGEQLAAPAVVPFAQLQGGSLLAAAAASFVDAGGDAALVKAAGITLPEKRKKAMSV
jgi:hypothetical protein